MELQDLLSGALAGKIGKKVGVSEDAVGSILESALPQMLGGLKKNSDTKEGADSLFGALMDHADDDDDVDNVDEEDGAKIVDHIFGSKSSTVKKNLSKVAGDIDVSQVGKILSLAAPLLMGSLGSSAKKKKEEEEESGFDFGSLLGGLMGGGSSAKSSGGFDIGSLLGGVLGGSAKKESPASAKTSSKKKTTTENAASSKKKASKKNDGIDAGDIGDAVNLIGKLFGK